MNNWCKHGACRWAYYRSLSSYRVLRRTCVDCKRQQEQVP